MELSKYEKRGVSSDKKDVHLAIKNIDKGLFPAAFCKILPDYLTNDPDYGIAMHTDTAGTKTSLAYLYWKETGDLSVWEGIVQDAIVMNLDDLACLGAFDNIILSSTIGRNKFKIPGEIIKVIIEGAEKFISGLRSHGLNIYISGGETADVGDIVRTIDVGYTAVARMKRADIISVNIQPGDVILALESYGQSSYESSYNSGIACNGLTFARHEVLNNYYAEKYPESFDPALDKDTVYSGNCRLLDKSEIKGQSIGQLLLSPTRTYLPVLSDIVKKFRPEIHGIIHCTGGGQTKVLHFIDKLHIIKNDLFEIPPVFNLIQKQNNVSWQEIYQVFNMGHRMEIYTSEKSAQEMINQISNFNIRAKIIGYCEKSDTTSVSINSSVGNFSYIKD